MGCGCGKRAEKALDAADKYGIPLPRVVRRHFERTARKAEDGREEVAGDSRRVSVRQGER